MGTWTAHRVLKDARRFEDRLSMDEAIGYSRSLWDASEVVCLSLSAAELHPTLELLPTLKFGRKRIVDTALVVPEDVH